MRITRAKYHKETVCIDHEEEREIGVDEHSLKSMDPPAPSLINALAALKPHVIKMLELPASYADGLNVIAVKWAYPETGCGATITCLKQLKDSNAPLVLNTPYTPFEAAAEGQPCMSTQCVIDLDALQDAARDYIQGERGAGSQAQLPLGGEDGVAVTLTHGGKSVTVTPKQFEIATRMEECRDTLKKLWGSLYATKIMIPMARLRKTIREQELNVVDAVKVCIDKEGHGDGTTEMVYIAAAAEIMTTDSRARAVAGAVG